MLFDAADRVTPVVPPDPARPSAVMGRGLVFDWTEKHYLMENGGPVECIGAEAVKAWLEQVIRTRVGKYAVHPTDYGCSALELIGQKIPRGFALSEIRRELLSSAAYCRAIEELSELIYDGERINCTVKLRDGNEASVSFSA